MNSEISQPSRIPGFLRSTNNYIFKSLFLFVSSVIICIFLVAFVQYLSLDNALIKSKRERLSEINQEFSKSVLEIVKSDFSLIDFLVQTSYPAVAVEYGLTRQFYSITDNMESANLRQTLGIILFNSKGRLFSSRKVSSGHDFDSLSTQIKRIKSGSLFLAGDQIVYIQPFFHTDKTGAVGFLGGALPKDVIARAIMRAYYERTLEFASLQPKIEIDFNNHSTNHGTAIGLDSRSINLSYSSADAYESILKMNALAVAGVVGFTAFILVIFTYVLRRGLRGPVVALLKIANQISEGNSEISTGQLPTDPVFRKIGRSLIKMNQQRLEFEREKREREVASKLTEVASQLAHDIRSPLSALEMVTESLSDIPENKRVFLRRSIYRIKDIANEFLESHRYNKQAHEESACSNDQVLEQILKEPKSLQLLTALTENMVLEKRLQYRVRSDVTIEAQYCKQAYGVFANVQPKVFLRALSNIIDNAVESISGAGRVTVRIYRSNRDVVVSIKDNGCGIPVENLPLITDRGFSYGKANGSGLGLYYAKTAFEAWGGQVKIDSTVSSGTTVELCMPRTTAPNWFVPRLKIETGTTIVVLDDDPTIHEIWKDLFSPFDLGSLNCNLVHFSCADDFIIWFDSQQNSKSGKLFLFDYELIGQQISGLDLINALKLHTHAVLVTSRYDDNPEIVKACNDSLIHLIPKELARFVPISFVEKSANLDAVLIDDELVHSSWEAAASKYKKRLLGFSSSEDFFGHISEIEKDIPIYVDYDLREKETGDILSKKLHEIGFKNLFISTGFPSHEFEPMPWIKGVIDKAPPWHISAS